MAKSIAPPPKPAQTPTGRWLYYLIAMPWLQLVVGIVVLFLAEKSPEVPSLFEGATISLYCVALLAGTVCAFGSCNPPPISNKLRKATEQVLQIVLLFSVVLIVLVQTANIRDVRVFLAAQALLALIALPFSWKARA